VEAGLQIGRTLSIPEAELTWRTTRSGGPGGQHANTSDTRVEVSFDVAASATLSRLQRERLLERLGPTVRASSSDTRSQAENRRRAGERLAVKIEEALRPDKARNPTRPTKASRRRRVEEKRRRSDLKRQRRRPTSDD